VNTGEQKSALPFVRDAFGARLVLKATAGRSAFVEFLPTAMHATWRAANVTRRRDAIV